MTLHPDPWLLLDSGLCEFALNMAIDEAMLETAAETGLPILRFYGWQQPAASFGYFQHIAEIEAVTPLRPLVRRPTGGGLVPHDADWTYSVAVPPAHSWYEMRATESYERIHRWLQLGFAELDYQTELAPCCRNELPGQCFAGYEKFDLLRLGSKIAGAAQRRTRTGLLIQGSVQPTPRHINRAQWQIAMSAAGTKHWNIAWTEWSPPKAVTVHAESLRGTKYSRDSYNRKR